VAAKEEKYKKVSGGTDRPPSKKKGGRRRPGHAKGRKKTDRWKSEKKRLNQDRAQEEGKATNVGGLTQPAHEKGRGELKK